MDFKKGSMSLETPRISHSGVSTEVVLSCVPIICTRLQLGTALIKKMMWTKHLLASVVLFSCGFCFEFVEKNERILLGSNNRPILTSFSRCKKSSVTEGKLICTCGNNNKVMHDW